MIPSERPLYLFNSLTRSLEPFRPLEAGRARVYSCGPTVYSYQHIGNLRAYLFTDTLSRALTYKGYAVTHIVNITDVGHLMSDADSGVDKMEMAAAKAGRSAHEIARRYTEAFWRDIELLNIREPTRWTFATEHVADMIAFAEKIAADHCYLIDSGLYFDVTTVPSYGRLARAETKEGEARIAQVKGKRHPADFAIWRRSPPGESREMAWDSPWGRGAPGWHLGCSVMSMKYLGNPFDIHTGGIDHREIHHPNEIAQNQAYARSAHSGANVWTHNNFLVDRRGKMSKSAGDVLVLEQLVDRGFHPLAFRLMCLSAHYRHPIEFSFESLAAALSRLKRMIISIEELRHHGDPAPATNLSQAEERMLDRFDEAISQDLLTPRALTVLEDVIATTDISVNRRLELISTMDEVLGLQLLQTSRSDLRIRPAAAAFTVDEVTDKLTRRASARSRKNFVEADAIRTELVAGGIDVLDGDSLGWDWRLGL